MNDPTAALGLMAKIELSRAGATWRIAADEAIPILQLRSKASDRARMHCHRLSRLLAASTTSGDVRAFAEEAATIADSVVGAD